AKLDSQGNSLLYSSFLTPATITGLAVNASGNAYVTGSTDSVAFQTVNAIQPTATCASTGNCKHAFVSEFNPSGSGLVFSTYLGGTGSDMGDAITLDPFSNIYVAGATSSADFPAVNAVQPTLAAGAGANAFITKLDSSGSAFLYSTYLGGSCCDSASGLAADAYGNLYIAGTTFSRNFPTVKAVQPIIGGTANNPENPASSFSSDGFIAKISSSDSGGSARLIQ